MQSSDVLILDSLDEGLHIRLGSGSVADTIKQALELGAMVILIRPDGRELEALELLQRYLELHPDESAT